MLNLLKIHIIKKKDKVKAITERGFANLCDFCGDKKSWLAKR